jgi:hypothetical protein
MIAQTLFSFKLETTREKLTAHGGLALMAEFNHGIGIRELANKCLPQPQSNRGFMPSVFVDTLVLMLESGGVSLEDIRELKYEEGLMKLLSESQIPSPDAVGVWLRRMGKDICQCSDFYMRPSCAYMTNSEKAIHPPRLGRRIFTYRVRNECPRERR